MPLFTTKPTDQFFERFMKHQPNFKPDAPEADRIQVELDAMGSPEMVEILQRNYDSKNQ